MSCDRELSVWSIEMSAPLESDPRQNFRLPITYICAHAWGTGCTAECGGVVFLFLNFGLIS